MANFGTKEDQSLTPIAGAFHMPEAPVLRTRSLHKSVISLTEIRSDHRNFGISASMPYAEAYHVVMQLRPCHDHDLYFDGRKMRPENWGAGSVSFMDLRRDPIADVRDPFHSLHFFLPHSALRELSADVDAPRINDIRVKPAVGLVDPVVRQMLLALKPGLAHPEQLNVLFVDHVALALTAHVAHVYGAMQRPHRLGSGALASWQERRAKEAISAQLDGGLSLDALAAECGLSRSYFARAFRRTTGKPPHQWLLEQRVEAAKRLLMTSTASLSEIALECGFADQSHFTRVFARLTGAPPGSWRRLQ
ncbi:MAG: AraC family transcriptional regulator [Nevskia sp.]|nr:AraC family transcriptional regulator [Nevskia sp.]